MTRKRKREDNKLRKRTLDMDVVSAELISRKRTVPTNTWEGCGTKGPREKDSDGQASSKHGKTTGADGYFFECVVCDIGGNLLCCDKCPCTYHLECLVPPLKRTPPGKWHCPACRDQQTGSVKVGSELKRARSSRRVEELPAVHKSFLKHSRRNETSEKCKATLQVPEQGIESPREELQKEDKGQEGLVHSDILGHLYSRHGNGGLRPDSTEPSPSDRCCKSRGSEPINHNAKSPEELVYPNEKLEDIHSIMTKDETRDKKDHNAQGSDSVACVEVDRIFGCRVTSVAETSTSERLQTLKKLQNEPEGHSCSPAQMESLPMIASSERENTEGCNSGQELERVKEAGNKSIAWHKKNHNGWSSASSLVSEANDLSVDNLDVILKDGHSKMGENNNLEDKKDLLNPTGKQCPQIEMEYLVKWVGKSHIHDEWIVESRLKVLAKRKLDNYKFKYGTSPVVLVDERWHQPQRIIARRKGNRGSVEVFVKWCGLPYDECTWEQSNDPVIQNCSELIAKFDRFEVAASKRDRMELVDVDYKPGEVATLVEQPAYLMGGSLFPHQIEALNWLRKSWGRKKNVILADEMGLGKTISALVFISTLYEEFSVGRPCLVLVPLSTMPNWMAEFSAWTPSLNVVEYHGGAKARAMIRQFEWHAGEVCQDKKKQRAFKYNVLLTTYEMILADANQLRAVPWEVLIVDEGHRLKNSGSKLFQLLNTFSFSQRVLLTGTPLQNNVGEMHNLLNFLQPDMFPSLVAFEEKFNCMSTTEQIDELKRMVAPHMLRRLKKDTMQNIPPKTERIVPVELTSLQAEYYRAFLTRNYQVLRQSGKSAHHKSLVNIVVQLRKVCNHPYLISGTEPESGSPEFLHEMRIKASAKLTLLHVMLKSLRIQGHRVLIFSQMTKLLDILEDYLTFEYGHEAFERVDGSITVAERQEAIARFNHDTSRFVFLLSTRACGLGINLATADTVIIYDSDFNPHADIQAMNRAHRIGQSKWLLVYRLVVRASVEERILQLAKKKLMLDHLFANKSGSQKEVEDILKWGTEELFQDAPIQQCEEQGNSTHMEIVVENLEEPDPKQRKKLGGLGDVYEDTCHKAGRPKLIWDNAAVARLLDRSNLALDVTEGESETDILGSLKVWDWNEQDNADDHDPVECVNKRDADSPVDANAYTTQGSEEGSGWDKILRRRWEKLQNEEEGTLGRGKRMRKAVSYKDDINTAQAEYFMESGNEDDADAEPEYTPAGKALKAKLAKLRARQKERIAFRCQTSNVSEMCEVDNAMAELPVVGVDNSFSCGPRVQLAGLEPHVFFSGHHIKSDTSVDDLSQKCRDTDETCVHAAMPAIFATSTREKKAIPHLEEAAVQTGGLTTSSIPLVEKEQQSLHIIDSLQGVYSKCKHAYAPDLAEQSRCFLPRDPSLVGNLHDDHSMNLTMGLGLGGFCRAGVDTMISLANTCSAGQSLSVFCTQLPETGGSSTFGKSSISHNEDIRTRNLPMFSFLGNMWSRAPVSESAAPWTEDELDALWSGVRRHGRGNWVSMLQDPKLQFVKSRTAKELADRWNDEQAKIFGSVTENVGEVSRPPSSLLVGPGGEQACIPPAILNDNLWGIRQPNVGISTGSWLQEFLPSSYGVGSVLQRVTENKRTGECMLPQMSIDLLSQREGVSKPCMFSAKDERAMLDLGSKLNLSTSISAQKIPSFEFHELTDGLGFLPQTSSQCQSPLFNRIMLDALVTNSAARGNMGSVDWKLSNMHSKLGGIDNPAWMKPLELPTFRNSPEINAWRVHDVPIFSSNLSLSGSEVPRKLLEAQGAALPPYTSPNGTALPVLEKQRVNSNPTGGQLTEKSSTKPNVSLNLPHWLREAVKPPQLLEPGLPPAIAALSQAIDLVYSDSKAVLSAWANPGSLPVLSQEVSRKKEGGIAQKSGGDRLTGSREVPGHVKPPNLIMHLKQSQQQSQPSVPVPKFSSKLLDANFASLEPLHTSMLSSLPPCPSFQWPFPANVETRDENIYPLSSELSLHLANTGTFNSISSGLQAGSFNAPSIPLDQFTFARLESLLCKSTEALKSHGRVLQKQQSVLPMPDGKESVQSLVQANMPHSGVPQIELSGVPLEGPTGQSFNNDVTVEKGSTGGSTIVPHSSPDQHLNNNTDVLSEQIFSIYQNGGD